MFGAYRDASFLALRLVLDSLAADHEASDAGLDYIRILSRGSVRSDTDGSLNKCLVGTYDAGNGQFNS